MQVALAIAMVGITLLPTTASASVYVQGGYYNDEPSRLAIQNQNFESGTTSWTVESGNAVQTSTYYRSKPTAPYSLYVYGTRYVNIRQDLSMDTINQISANYVTFSFWFRTDYNDLAKAQLAIYDRYWEGGCKCWIGGWNYYESPWTYPSPGTGDLAWTNVVVKGYGSTLVTQAYVRILLDARADTNPTVSSYIDDAALSLYDSTTTPSPYGNAALTYAVKRVDDWPNDLRYNAAYFSVAMSGQASGNYKIGSIQIRIEFEPTTQDADMWVEGTAQGNDLNRVVNAQDQQKQKEEGLVVATIGIGIVTGFFTAGLGSPVAAFEVGTAADVGTTILFHWFGESSNQFDTTAYGGADYFTQVRWNYPSSYDCSTQPPERVWVARASGANDGVWVYWPGVPGYRLKFVTEIGWLSDTVEQTQELCPITFRRQVGTTSLVGYVVP